MFFYFTSAVEKRRNVRAGNGGGRRSGIRRPEGTRKNFWPPGFVHKPLISLKSLPELEGFVRKGGNGGAYVSQLTHMVRILTSSRLRKPCRYANKNIIMLQTLIRPRYNKKFGINITTRAEYSPRESCERIKLQRFPKSASRAMHGPRAFAIAHADAEAGPRAFAGSRASAIGARGRRGWAARLRHRPCGRRGRTARLRQAARLRRLARRGRRGSCRLPSPARPPSPSHTRTSRPDRSPSPGRPPSPSAMAVEAARIAFAGWRVADVEAGALAFAGPSAIAQRGRRGWAARLRRAARFRHRPCGRGAGPIAFAGPSADAFAERQGPPGSRG